MSVTDICEIGGDFQEARCRNAKLPEVLNPLINKQVDDKAKQSSNPGE